MQNRPIPSLTKRGWIKTKVNERADFILAYFFETLPSETWMYRENTTSIQDLISKYTNDVDNLVSELQRRLEERFSLYFDRALVTVEITNPEEYQRTGQAAIGVKIIIVEDGTDYSIDREFREINSVFKVVVKEVNYGY